MMKVLKLLSPFSVAGLAVLGGLLVVGGFTAFGESVPVRRVLFDFDGGFQIKDVAARDIQLSLTGSKSDRRLRLASGHKIDWPGITLKPKREFWDGSRYQHVSFEITNLGKTGFELGLRIDDPKKNFTVMNFIAPGDSRTIRATLYPTSFRFSKPLALHGMHAAPGQSTVDASQIKEIILFLRQPKSDHLFSIDNVRFETPMRAMDPEKFMPFIDEFGQFIHDAWPGKTHTVADFAKHLKAEEKDLEAHPGPANFDRFGGWLNGPKLASSKFFRTEKLDGKWWLVNPDGRLFWSHGIDAVSFRFGGSGIEHREEYFRDLPKKGDRLASFYGRSSWGMNFYHNKTPYRTYNFQAANLDRKYGKEWTVKFADKAHRRLRSWGLNTLASWSDDYICEQRRTPYVGFVHIEKGPVLMGAEKMWTQFHDVFDSGFREKLAHGIDACAHAIGDPWCMGFYIDNELYWGSETDLAVWTLQGPGNQAAKQVFIDDLQAKYGTVKRLNAVWGSSYKDWREVSQSTRSPNVNKARADLEVFSRKTAEVYFRTVKEELAKRAPDQLYLGCRFIWDNPGAVRAASRFCDVVSFNRYTYGIEHLRLPEGEDKPIVIGEFHFGAMDRGLFHPTKVPARDQQHRAECYKNFVRSALRNPAVVGTHWFQYISEPTAGRGDGENYQTGFVDVCDTPYAETVAAAREIGNELYGYRAIRGWRQ